MDRYEYKIEKIIDPKTKFVILNLLGAEGWQLIDRDKDEYTFIRKIREG